MNVTDKTIYDAARLTRRSANDFGATRARFDHEVPPLDPAIIADLVLGSASWAQVEQAIETRIGPHGLFALARLDQGALLSLDGQPLEATLYLVGNPLIARRVTAERPAGALYAPFRVAVFSDDDGVQVSYDQPSSVFASLGSAVIDEIAADLDAKIAAAAEVACRAE
jgi:uncharacterized protein (DUF302 family)